MDDGVWRGCLAGLGHSLARSSLEAQLPTGQGALGGKKARSGLTPAAVLFSRGRPIRAEGGSAAFVEVYYEPLVSFFFSFFTLLPKMSIFCAERDPTTRPGTTSKTKQQQHLTAAPPPCSREWNLLLCVGKRDREANLVLRWLRLLGAPRMTVKSPGPLTAISHSLLTSPTGARGEQGLAGIGRRPRKRVSRVHAR